jgi:hypothetical protein
MMNALVERVSRRLRFGAPITVVSGLPRSGTSMAMRMLEAGGVPILTDGIRTADDDNPNGYFEFEAVKRLERNLDAAWLRDARGRAVKIISLLLTWLPETYDYRVVFMQRDLDEVIASQRKMLIRRGEPGGDLDAAAMRERYAGHLAAVQRFLASRRCFRSLSVGYREVLEHPDVEAGRINDFIGGHLDVDRMAAVADRQLHRNRR